MVAFMRATKKNNPAHTWFIYVLNAKKKITQKQQSKMVSWFSSYKERNIGTELTSFTIPSPPTHTIPVNKREDNILNSETKWHMMEICKKKYKTGITIRAFVEVNSRSKNLCMASISCFDDFHHEA